MFKIIGIDPGLAGTGIGIVQGVGKCIDNYSFGVVGTSKNDSLPDRLNQIFLKLEQVLKNEEPDLMVVEEVFSVKKFPQAGITLGKVSGVIMLAGCKAGVSVVEVPVREAKQILSGFGNASKSQLEMSVRHILEHDQPIRPVHASDALALAIIGLYRYS
ncbi:MAG: crossover junction endodeoxyribonuclease [Desulfobacteraceae bacterium 4572_19]|nr:MAG: crossover junction endodeoxyribonuclease [Desulfobacteraceae bacterium 4572_19]